MASTYSHGLEKIYGFEVLNPQTVRRVETQPLTSVEKSKAKEPERAIPETFDFGDGFSEGVTSFYLDASLEVLHLTPFQLKAVHAAGIKTVRELLLNLPQFKAHAEEIRGKIEELLGKDPFQKKKEINFFALISKILGGMDAKERFSFLKMYGAESLFPLRPVELHEVEKWTVEMRLQAVQKVKDALLKEREYVEKKWSEITKVHLISWLEKRGGLAQEFELEERLFQISENSSQKEIDLLRTIGRLLFGSLFHIALESPEEGIFTVRSEWYLEVIRRSKSYFYTPFTTYRLDALLALVTRDFAKEWIGFSDHFIQNIYLSSPSFQLFRNETGAIFIQKRVL